MNVLSLFDGISCGQLALRRAGIRVDKYYASEIDKYTISIAKKNFPDTIHLGDVNTINVSELEPIDLLIGGSPCQGFSLAGKQLNFDDPRSALFFKFVDILNDIRQYNPNIKFLLENVKMKKEYRDVISEYLGVEPVLINSALVSAQNRERYYWANWPITQPEDKGILLKDIVQHGEVDRDKSYALDASYYKGGSEKTLKRLYYDKSRRQVVIEGAAMRGRYDANGKVVQQLEDNGLEKSNALTTVQKDTLLKVANPAALVGRRLDDNGKRQDYSDIPTEQCLEVHEGDKSRCLSTVQKDTLISSLPEGRYPSEQLELEEGLHYRKLTPLECERLQTLPDNYTEGVSNTQRYRALGNGWTVEVISWIFQCLKNNDKLDEGCYEKADNR